jgi:tRNA pseudouridine55 synthase
MARRRKGQKVDGWIVFDKPVGMTSTQAVGFVRHHFQAQKAGHAGTLDPLASGCLPIALGEATKTVPYIQDGRKMYRFTVGWGHETSTDDLEGVVTASSHERPSKEAVQAILSSFTGEIQQVPPRFSALKINGERAYDIARDGGHFTLEARSVTVYRLELISMPDAESAVFEAECGKGTYIRSLARDMGQALGCLGHIKALRRLRVGPFEEASFVSKDQIEGDNINALLLPVEEGLFDVASITVNQADAGRLSQGMDILLRGKDAPVSGEAVYALSAGRLIALGEIKAGRLVPKRVFQIGRA